MFFLEKLAKELSPERYDSIEDVEVNLKDWGTGEHPLVQTLNNLKSNSTIDTLHLRGDCLGLAVLLSFPNGSDDYCYVPLPKTLNNVNFLKIDLNQPYPNPNGSIYGKELSILLGALQNVENLEICCNAVINSDDHINGFFAMNQVSLPQLKSCKFITSSDDDSLRKIPTGIIECLLASAPNLKQELIEQQFIPKKSPEQIKRDKLVL